MPNTGYSSLPACALSKVSSTNVLFCTRTGGRFEPGNEPYPKTLAIIMKKSSLILVISLLTLISFGQAKIEINQV
ncbi:MAG: hypothetical protein JXA68_05710, partial [Ignavibacteriales bacterium]|nr:hypothetical protein [Ignavibacteriales bacterium]